MEFLRTALINVYHSVRRATVRMFTKRIRVVFAVTLSVTFILYGFIDTSSNTLMTTHHVFQPFNLTVYFSGIKSSLHGMIAPTSQNAKAVGSNTFKDSAIDMLGENVHSLPKPVSDKWIVVTSIQYPTKDVERLASLEGWNLVVVADRKTPLNWTLDSVHFLSLQFQKQLGFKTTSLIPENSYTRKNIGYLYAIKRGARWIYDTDDDNKPYGKGLEQFDYTDTISALCYNTVEIPKTPLNLSSNLFNPYRFFGHPIMWPRGFPLEHLKYHTNGKDRLLLCGSMRVPAVQQGLVHKDPDVDAIYRLLYADKKTGLNERFSEVVPPIVLSAGTYSPWNSQNTLFHRNAFFTMFLPVTVEFRVTDIWRSYVAQKLLHMIGERIAFYPTNAIQVRNAHDYMADYDQEADLYDLSGKLVDHLHTWNCSSTNISTCAIELAESLEKDTMLMKLWMDDLEAIGYEFPKIPTEAPKDGCGKADELRGTSVNRAHLLIKTDIPVRHDTPTEERAEEKLEYLEDLYDWCNEGTPGDYFRSAGTRAVAEAHSQNRGLVALFQKVLIVVVERLATIELGILQRLYQPYFAITVFCGPIDFWDLTQNGKLTGLKDPLNYVTISSASEDNVFSRCIQEVHKMRFQNVRGYFAVKTTSILKFWIPVKSDLSYGVVEESTVSKWEQQEKRQAGDVALELLTQKYSSDNLVQDVWRNYTDGVKQNRTDMDASIHLRSHTGWARTQFIYIPDTRMSYFNVLMNVLLEASFDEGFALAKFLQSVPSREVPESKMLLTDTGDLWKLSDPDEKKRFCKSVMAKVKEDLVDSII